MKVISEARRFIQTHGAMLTQVSYTEPVPALWQRGQLAADSSGPRHPLVLTSAAAQLPPSCLGTGFRSMLAPKLFLGTISESDFLQGGTAPGSIVTVYEHRQPRILNKKSFTTQCSSSWSNTSDRGQDLAWDSNKAVGTTQPISSSTTMKSSCGTSDLIFRSEEAQR